VSCSRKQPELSNEGKVFCSKNKKRTVQWW